MGEDLEIHKPLSLEDLEIRYQNIRKNNPKVKNCSVEYCPNPRDSTPLMGEDTCCAYHRLLFDFWCGDTPENVVVMTKYQRRESFDVWLASKSKELLDEIVLRMMSEPINWEC